MTQGELFNKVREILVEEFELDADKVKPESLLFEELELDSIDAVDLIVKLKSHIPQRISPEQFKQVRTVQDVVEVLFPLMS